MKALFIATIGATVGLIAGCFLRSAPPVVAGQTTFKTYKAASELAPDTLPYKSAKLILSGTSLPVEMSRSQSNDTVTFSLTARKEVLEVERYQSDATGFRFSGLTDESFAPPIPIVRYPFVVGESWTWSGIAGLGSNGKQATAILNSNDETLNLAGGVHSCVLVVANVVVESPGGTKSKRILKFWIEPLKGIVKREFGFSSTREPRPAGSP